MEVGRHVNNDGHLMGDAVSHLVDGFFGPFANGLLTLGRPYILRVLNVAIDRFRANGISSSRHVAAPPTLNGPNMVLRALITFIAITISFLLSRRVGGGWTSCLLLLCGQKYTEIMAIDNRNVMVGLREAAFWELGMAWVSFCYTMVPLGCSKSQEMIVYSLTTLQVMCARDVLINEGQVYLINDEPLATQSVLWMSMCSMCYFMPRWFAIALFLATWLIALLAKEAQYQSDIDYENMPQYLMEVLSFLTPLVKEIKDCKGIILFNASFSIPCVVLVAFYTSNSYFGFFLCMVLSFLLFYASKSPEPFLRSNTAPPLLVCFLIATFMFLPLRFIIVLLVGIPTIFVMLTSTNDMSPIDCIQTRLEQLQQNLDVEQAMEHMMSFHMWYISFLSLGTLCYMEILPPDIHGFTLCILLIIFSYVCVLK